MKSQDVNADDARFAAEFSGDVTVERIAAVYAEAFLDAASRAGDPAEFVAELDEIVEQVLRPFPKFAEVLGSSMILHQEKVGIIDRVFKNRISPLSLNFLKVLSRRNRLEIFLPIVRAIHQEWDRRRGLVPVRVVTATPVDDNLARQIEEQLKGLIEGVPLVSWRVEPNLLGGVLIAVGDKIIDASVSAQLQRVKQRIINRSAHEIQSRRDRFCNTTGN